MLEAPPHEQQRHQHAHADQSKRTGSASLRSAQLPPCAQALLFEGMLDRLATIGARPGWECWKKRQLRHHPHMRREMVEHAQDAEQGIGSFLQEFACARGTQGQVRRRACAQFDC